MPVSNTICATMKMKIILRKATYVLQKRVSFCTYALLSTDWKFKRSRISGLISIFSVVVFSMSQRCRVDFP